MCTVHLVHRAMPQQKENVQNCTAKRQNHGYRECVKWHISNRRQQFFFCSTSNFCVIDLTFKIRSEGQFHSLRSCISRKMCTMIVFLIKRTEACETFLLWNFLIDKRFFFVCYLFDFWCGNQIVRVRNYRAFLRFIINMHANHHRDCWGMHSPKCP